jgi:transaldolase
MAMNPLRKLQDEGVSVWLDYLDRNLMRSGRLRKLIDEDGIRGETSNPTIFQKGVSSGRDYDQDIHRLASGGKTTEEICWEVMISDVKEACDAFRPLYNESEGLHGFVSLELDPTLARETDASIRQGRELWNRVDRANLMLKVPATEEGLPVVETLLYEGLNINVTLLFAVRRYEEVMDAFLRALTRRAGEGKPVDRIASVASFFVSRVDSEADKRLDKCLESHPEWAEKITGLRGKVAVANSRMAYGAFQRKFGGETWKKLEAKGARLQNPLWASTSTKNPAYSDILYVQDLIGPDCVNTMPDDTIDAYRDHGVPKRTLTEETLADAGRVLALLAEVDVDIEEITLKTLVDDGVYKFEVSYRDLLRTIEEASKKK